MLNNNRNNQFLEIYKIKFNNLEWDNKVNILIIQNFNIYNKNLIKLNRKQIYKIRQSKKILIGRKKAYLNFKLI